MKVRGKIVTVGFSPAWDITCRGEGLDWGLHKEISEVSCRPAGKALNISRALAWMGQRSTAAGLWGRQDYERMLEDVRLLRGLVKVKSTVVAGATRRNITVVDTASNREMHLRSRSELASRGSLRRLKADLKGLVGGNSVCVFAGSMPEKLLGDVAEVINTCRDSGAKIVLDTSGRALRRIVDCGGVWLIKPNVEELCELLGRDVSDRSVSLVKAARELLDKVEMVLISRGKKGAIVVTRDGAWQGRCTRACRRTASTVACGDCLLAGFLKGLKEKGNAGSALRVAIRVATARAWGWTEKMSWPEAQRQIKVKVGRM